jgi:hypothetical protein
MGAYVTVEERLELKKKVFLSYEMVKGNIDYSDIPEVGSVVTKRETNIYQNEDGTVMVDDTHVLTQKEIEGVVTSRKIKAFHEAYKSVVVGHKIFQLKLENGFVVDYFDAPTPETIASWN